MEGLSFWPLGCRELLFGREWVKECLGFGRAECWGQQGFWDRGFGVWVGIYS